MNRTMIFRQWILSAGLLVCALVTYGAFNLGERLRGNSAGNIDEEGYLVPEPQLINVDCSSPFIQDEPVATNSSLWGFVAGQGAVTLHQENEFHIEVTPVVTISINPGHKCVIWVEMHGDLPIELSEQKNNSLWVDALPRELVFNPSTNVFDEEELQTQALPLINYGNWGISSRIYRLRDPLKARRPDAQGHGRVIGFSVGNMSDKPQVYRLEILP